MISIFFISVLFIFLLLILMYAAAFLFYVAWRLTVTVNTAVYLVLAVGQSELLLKLLLAGGDAARDFCT